MRIPGIYKPSQGANVAELLSEKIEEGDKTKTVYKTHPHGSRRERRSKQRHHPFFTKTRTGGRLWEIGVRDLQRERKKKDGESSILSEPS